MQSPCLPFHYRARELFPRYRVVGLVGLLLRVVVVLGDFLLGVAEVISKLMLVD